MKKVPLLFLLAACQSAELQPARDARVEVTYVANEGFLIEAAGGGVLVDALFGEPAIDWCHVPEPGLLESLETARPPYDGIDWILVTHAHVDHFDPERVRRCLASHPGATLVAPPQAVARLRELAGWSAELEERTAVPELELFESLELEGRGARIEATRLRHCFYPLTDESGRTVNKHEKVENLGFRIELGGASMVHVGDAFLNENADFFASEDFLARGVDLFFLEGWNPESLEILGRVAPRHTIFMHLPADPEVFARLAAELPRAVPGSLVFEERSQKRTLRLHD